jgi:folate-binding protein YgfZ
MEDAAVQNVSGAFGWAMLHGPRAHTVARAILGDSNSEVRAVCASIDFTGLGGVAIVAPLGDLDHLRTAAARREGVVVASGDDWQRLRVERVLPIYGIDIDDRRSPHEAALDRRAVSWTKGCYLGQEAVCMQDMRGKVKRRLVALRLSSSDVPEAGASVTRLDGSDVGETRSAASSHVWGGPVALALLSAEVAVPGTELRVGDAVATVIEPR